MVPSGLPNVSKRTLALERVFENMTSADEGINVRRRRPISVLLFNLHIFIRQLYLYGIEMFVMRGFEDNETE